VWLLAVVALVGGGIAVALSMSGDDDSGKAGDTIVSEPDTEETAPETTETTEPADTEPVATEESTTPETVVETTEATAPPTTVAATDVVAGAPAGQSGDRANPVPPGAVADIGSGWRLQILSVNPDAAAAIAAENEFNEPPPPGSTFSMITVALGYFGLEDPTSVFETTISAVGASNVELPSGCGVLPQPLDMFGDVFAGGVVVGNVCFVTTPADAPVLQLYASGDFFGEVQVFLDASTSPAPAVPMASLAGPQPGAASTPSRTAPTAVGTAADVGEGWQVAVVAPARDITDAVMAENTFNTPPPDGYRFIGVDVAYAYSGSGSGSPFNVTTKAVGSSNIELSSQCGVIPNEIDISSDVFSGGNVTGTVCFVVPAATPDLVLYSTASFDTRVMFATV